MHGAEYDELVAVLDEYADKFDSVVIAEPLLGEVGTDATAINEDMGRDTAKWVANIVDDVELDFPVVFDWENWSKFRKYQISIHDLNNTFRAFDEELKKHNLSAMLYGSKYYLETMWEEDIKNNYPVWLAHYTNEMTDYQGKFKMWQMCSDGRIDGIQGDVDIDILYK